MKNKVYINQNIKSDEHEDAMFYSGIIAVATEKVNGKYVCLMTRDAEIIYNNKKYVGQEIDLLASFYVICDEDIEYEVDVLVDGFFFIAELDMETLTTQLLEDVDEQHIFTTYTDAIQEFTNYCL